MNNLVALLAPSIARFVLILSASFAFTAIACADELKEISQLAEQGQTAVALDRVNTFIAANPKNPQGLFMKGVLLAEQGRREEAIRVFTDVTEKFPSLPEPYNNLAVLYADQGQFDKARKALETAIKTHPSYATAHENLGDIYARMASEAYGKALQLDTANARAQGKLSLIKDLFGTGNKTTIAANEPAKNISAAPAAGTAQADIKKANSAAPANARDAITASVNKWAHAWSSKNLDQYFASYGASFKPAKGLSRQAWEQQRKERISKPEKISVEISDLKIESDDSTAKAKFKQSYRADGQPIRTSKALLMKRDGDNWYIVEEIASN
ncbi:tetratricopeptide repeat protein [Methylotenera sp. G11]|uniref:tetratricopeptide repeat protein n=1 Tax=Methylotenera sp. G11 TaxID=1506585 RepID=UPI0006467420|nr:tetratricopeptide repeat protein [Methylotenera sp. G11]